MPTITLDLSPAALARLEVVVADYNAANGQALTVDRFLDIHVRELATHRELAAKIEQLKKQADDDLAAAVEAERQRLLATVAAKGTA